MKGRHIPCRAVREHDLLDLEDRIQEEVRDCEPVRRPVDAQHQIVDASREILDACDRHIAGRGVGGDLDSPAAAEDVIHRVPAVAAPEHVCVIAATTRQDVVAGATIQHVVPLAPG